MVEVLAEVVLAAVALAAAALAPVGAAAALALAAAAAAMVVPPARGHSNLLLGCESHLVALARRRARLLVLLARHLA